MPVTISETGRIASPSSNPDVSGRVSADGSYSLMTSETGFWYDERRGRIQQFTYNLKSNGIMELDPDGNIVATSNRDTHGFVLLRQ